MERIYIHVQYSFGWVGLNIIIFIIYISNPFWYGISWSNFLSHHWWCTFETSKPIALFVYKIKYKICTEQDATIQRVICVGLCVSIICLSKLAAHIVLFTIFFKYVRKYYLKCTRMNCAAFAHTCRVPLVFIGNKTLLNYFRSQRNYNKCMYVEYL